MNHVTKCLLAVMAGAMLLFAGGAMAGPPDFAGQGGGPPSARGGDGPPFGHGSDDNPGGGLEPRQQQGDDDDGDGNANRGRAGNGPPGLCGVDGEGPSGRAGRSHIAHLNFFQRDPDTGERVDDGPWGRMKYVWAGPLFDFVFNAHELEPGDEHTMTYQPEPTPSPGVICLGNGVVNDEGDLHIANAIELNGDLPAPFDESEEGALLVLVLSDDVNCDDGEMNTFIAEDYLFGDALIEYVDTDFEGDDDDGDD